jgi:hypothetical protein
MRMVLIGLAAIMCMLSTGIGPATAQTRPWCIQSGNGGPGDGLPSCDYHTQEQCRAAIGSGTDGCFPNPALGWDRIEGKRQPPRRQSRERGY